MQWPIRRAILEVQQSAWQRVDFFFMGATSAGTGALGRAGTSASGVEEEDEGTPFNSIDEESTTEDAETGLTRTGLVSLLLLLLLLPCSSTGAAND